MRGTLVLDFLALGSSTGLAVRELTGSSVVGDSTVATASAVIFLTAAVVVLIIVIAVIQTLMLIAIQMASPLGGDPRDLPVIYYVKDTAKTGLELVLRNEQCSRYFTDPAFLARIIQESSTVSYGYQGGSEPSSH